MKNYGKLRENDIENIINNKYRITKYPHYKLKFKK